MDYVRNEVRYETLFHRVQYACVVPVGDEQYVFEMAEIENVDALKSGEPAVRIVYILLLRPLFQPVRQRLQVRVTGQYFLETDAGRTDRQIRLLQVRERIDVGIVHRRVQERHQRTLRANNGINVVPFVIRQ